MMILDLGLWTLDFGLALFFPGENLDEVDERLG
ncbi:MAG: hypothetical protein QOF02_3147 [Blastocatellia bacterium]|jgi:hypothetical protein|nr:hypothetical protein [Blastocatellia bacterium]